MIGRHLDYETFSDARKNLSEVFDAAQDGLVVNISRSRSRRDVDRGPVSVVRSADLARMLLPLYRDRFRHEHDPDIALHTVWVDGMPIAAEGETLHEAVEDAVADIREYCDEWPRLRAFKNHRDNEGMVVLFRALSNDGLASLFRQSEG